MKILIFDTETSGLPQERDASVLSTELWPHILQFAYILYDTSNNKIIDYNNFLINIKKDVFISPESISIHKITRKACNQNGIDIKIVLNKFNELLLNTDLIIGHNLQFDKNMIIVECIRNRITHNFNPQNIPIKSYCTMNNSKKMCNIRAINKNGESFIKYPKLLELYNHFFNDNPNNLHDAMADVIITLTCYYKMEYNKNIAEISSDIKYLKKCYL